MATKYSTEEEKDYIFKQKSGRMKETHVVCLEIFIDRLYFNKETSRNILNNKDVISIRAKFADLPCVELNGTWEEDCVVLDDAASIRTIRGTSFRDDVSEKEFFRRGRMSLVSNILRNESRKRAEVGKKSQIQPRRLSNAKSIKRKKKKKKVKHSNTESDKSDDDSKSDKTGSNTPTKSDKIMSNTSDVKEKRHSNVSSKSHSPTRSVKSSNEHDNHKKSPRISKNIKRTEIKLHKKGDQINSKDLNKLKESMIVDKPYRVSVVDSESTIIIKIDTGIPFNDCKALIFPITPQELLYQLIARPLNFYLCNIENRSACIIGECSISLYSLADIVHHMILKEGGVHSISKVEGIYPLTVTKTPGNLTEIGKMKLKIQVASYGISSFAKLSSLGPFVSNVKFMLDEVVENTEQSPQESPQLVRDIAYRIPLITGAEHMLMDQNVPLKSQNKSAKSVPFKCLNKWENLLQIENNKQKFQLDE